MSRWFAIRPIAAFLLCTATLIASDRIRVDVGADDGRRDTQTPHWTTWKVKSGRDAKQSFGGVAVTLRATEPQGEITSFLSKAGIDSGATMATDGVSNARGMVMEIEGLPPGPHTVVTYHNSIRDEPVGKLRVACVSNELNGSADSDDTTEGASVEPSRVVRHDDDAASAYLHFIATEVKPVVIRMTSDLRTPGRPVLFNGFEIDGNDPRRAARKTIPAHDDDHVDGDSGTVRLRWTTGVNAIRHDVYLAWDMDPGKCASTVMNADREDSAFVGSFNESQASVGIQENNSLLHYCWRVDEVDSSGGIARGEVWRFRARQLAFPGAEGYGRHARGGRGGRVIAVTNLNDSGLNLWSASYESQRSPAGPPLETLEDREPPLLSM